MTRKRLLLPLCLALAAGAACAQAYKWRDADGKVHFSDTPPPGGKADKLTIKPAVPEDPAAAARSRDWQTQLQESGTRRLEAQQKQDRAEHAAKAAEYDCQTARRDLDVLNRQRPVYRTGKDGQKEYLDDKDRPAAQKRAQDKVDRYCR